MPSCKPQFNVIKTLYTSRYVKTVYGTGNRCPSLGTYGWKGSKKKKERVVGKITLNI
jgi:hypothetical protein